jgi:tetratricopeptide (TPR) repeat protein
MPRKYPGLATRAPAVLLLSWMAAVLIAADNRNEVYEQAVADMKRGHPEAAIAALQPLVQSHPDDFKGLTLMGMATAAAGKFESANPYFEQALHARPAYPPALRGLATNEMVLNQHDAAKTHFEQLAKAAPGDPVAHAGLGEIAFAREDFAAALQHFEQANSLYRENPRLLIEYAKASIQLKQPDRAANALDGMPEKADAQAHFEAGVLLASLKSYKSAAHQFELALPGYPDQLLAGFNLVLARTKSEEYSSAIVEGEKLIAKGYQSAELYNLLAESYEKTGNTKRAYDSLRTATKLEPSDETNYVDLISLCIDHKNYDLASEIAAVGLTRLPRSERIHIELGVVFAMKEQFEEAQREFEAAGTLAPGRSLPNVALALIMMQMNRADAAVQRLRQRVSQFPDDYLALWYLGEALNRSGTTPGSAEHKEAIGALRRSVQLNPDISQSHELLGKLLAREGRLDEAASQLETAIKLEPGNEAAIYQLAQVYSKKGDAVRAKPLFAKVSKIKTEERENFASRRLQQIVRAESQ